MAVEEETEKKNKSVKTSKLFWAEYPRGECPRSALLNELFTFLTAENVGIKRLTNQAYNMCKQISITQAIC